MSAQKYIITVGLVIAALLAINIGTATGFSSLAAANKSHNLIVGYRLPGDRLVVRQSIVKNSSWMRIVTEEKTFNTTRYERITLIQALDQKTNGNGAYASILNGGPGHTNCTMRFKSQRGHGINFVVEVYARA
ncbi:PREDICTED: probable salivary secreted peptide [Dinoponera quadriceps]|uniref:Probable salivary secreted peptide n=1 Tax=Dinoponera quadriceps TaxID=609295 RepID=A0A6P3Y8S1_DINQU|nr:PREDICTED: probable salivary secreted peptide [Dinoponera quadriceps]